MTKKKRSLKANLPLIGRVAAGVLGLVIVIFLLHHAGLQTVLLALSHASSFFPIILLLELAVLTCSIGALRLLYGKDRHRLPWSALIHAGLVGYAVMGVIPAGRTAAETVRAALLSRYSTGARAIVAGTQLQAIALLANSAISLLASFAMASRMGFSVPTLLIVGNFFLTAVLGLGILLVGRKSKVGAWLGKKIPKILELGQELDRHFSGSTLIPLGPFLLELLGRIFQVIQNAILVVAVGGALGLIPAFCSEALHLVGAAVGDLIPGQLGATELNYRMSSEALGLSPADALSIALVAHLAQLFWVIVGLMVSILWPAKRRVNFS